MMIDVDNKEKQEKYVEDLEDISEEEVSRDPIADIIGDVGKWQIQKILLLFMISIPGLAMIFSVPFVFNKTDYWCDEEFSGSDENLATRMKVMTPENLTTSNICTSNCKKYKFDTTLWTNTVIMEWEMVCNRKYLAGIKSYFVRIKSQGKTQPTVFI